MYAITTARIHIPEFVDVYSIWDTRVDECEDTSIDKGLCSWLDVKFVTANGIYAQFGQNERQRVKIYIVAGRFWSLPKFPSMTPMSSADECQ